MKPQVTFNNQESYEETLPAFQLNEPWTKFSSSQTCPAVGVELPNGCRYGASTVTLSFGIETIVLGNSCTGIGTE